MNQTLPSSATYVVVGAGMHGMSTAWHLAMELEKSGRGKGSDVVLIDKTGPGAGATGVACGCVRNFYMTGPCMRSCAIRSMCGSRIRSISASSRSVMCRSAKPIRRPTTIKIGESQNAADYRSDVYIGKEAKSFLKSLWPDFNTDKAEVAVHEHPSGYAGTHLAVRGLKEKCDQWGVRSYFGIEVPGL